MTPLIRRDRMPVSAQPLNIPDLCHVKAKKKKKFRYESFQPGNVNAPLLQHAPLMFYSLCSCDKINIGSRNAIIHPNPTAL